MTSEGQVTEVTSVRPVNEVPDDEKAMVLAASGEYPYILILDKKEHTEIEDGNEEMTLVLDVSSDYYSDEGRERLKTILTAIAQSL